MQIYNGVVKMNKLYYMNKLQQHNVEWKNKLQNYICNAIGVNCKHLQYCILFMDKYIWSKVVKTKKRRASMNYRIVLTFGGREWIQKARRGLHKILSIRFFLCKRI